MVQTRDLGGTVGRDLAVQTLGQEENLCLEVQIQSPVSSFLVLSGPANLHGLGNLQDLPPPSLHPRPSPPPAPPDHLR